MSANRQAVLASGFCGWLVLLMSACGAGETDAPPAGAAAACDRAAFRIALDVGHTPESLGAQSARGVPELTFNTRLAHKIADRLHADGYDNVFLITAHGRGKAQLDQRLAQAAPLTVDLFLSIHHDDVQPVYHLNWTYGGRTHQFSDRFSGYSIFVSNANKFASRSLLFAELLGAELAANGLHFSAHHAEDIAGERRQLLDDKLGVYRFDQLVVLAHNPAPAVLLEAGIIVNRAEEQSLASPARQESISAAVATAVGKFCSAARTERDHP